MGDRHLAQTFSSSSAHIRSEPVPFFNVLSSDRASCTAKVRDSGAQRVRSAGDAARLPGVPVARKTCPPDRDELIAQESLRIAEHLLAKLAASNS